MVEEKCDSTQDTLNHIRRVQELLNEYSAQIVERGEVHDASKLENPEKEIFDRYTPLLRNTTFGTPEYEEFRAEMESALAHHYAQNRHHPEHFKDKGVAGMDLLDLTEMFFDWKAASERHNDGNIYRSIKQSSERFHLPEVLTSILINTARNQGWEK